MLILSQPLVFGISGSVNLIYPVWRSTPCHENQGASSWTFFVLIRPCQWRIRNVGTTHMRHTQLLALRKL